MTDPVTPPETPPATPPETPDIPKDVLDKAVEAALAPIKAKLDDAYAKRDEALTKAAAQEQKLKEVELQRLRDEGKETEALQSELDALKAEAKAKDNRIVELSRNQEVDKELSAFTFRNAKSRKMAFSDIVDELVQDEKGVWKHKSGKALSEYVKSFSEDDDNSFLFKSSESNGGGLTKPKISPNSDRKTSVFDLSQDEVIKRAAEGTLRNKE